MPNPLVRLGQQNTSQRDSKEGIAPVPETYAGRNLPYRGVVDHGVDVNTEPVEPQDWTDGRPVEYDAPPDDVTVVPVRIVEEGARELRRFRTSVAYAGGTDHGRARQIINQDENRTSVTIRNRTIDKTIWYSDKPETANELGGYPLDAGAEKTLTAHTAVYATVEDAADTAVHILVEYSSAT